MSLVLGIDPGLTGAMALIDVTKPKPEIVKVWDMPTHDIKGRRNIDIYQLALSIQNYYGQVRFAVIEDVHSMPRDGVVQAFSFGKANGIIIGIVAANMIPSYFVKPGVWKKLMGLTQDKDDSRRKASQLFPTNSNLWSRKMDDGRAEAVLLAVFGSERFK